MGRGGVLVAAATATGRAALAVVRLTGPGLEAVLAQIARARRPGPWVAGRARRVDLIDRDGVVDDGLLVWFAGPRSYTGEDLAEISIHGNPELVVRLVAACVDAGARVAGPGEFTRRAVVNGRLDLVRAEAVDQLVRAVGPAGIGVARAGLDGRLGDAFGELRSALVIAAAEIEARLDWPGDELALEDDAAVLDRLRAVGARASALAASHRRARARVDGATVALVGPVNVGKSSLFNRLLGAPRALVHDSPGTTRDLVESRVRWGSLDVRLVDTAGDRATDDPVEALGVELARQVVAEADLVLVVGRCRPEGPDPIELQIALRLAERPTLRVTTAVDLPGVVAPGSLAVSARTGEGVDALRDAIVARLTAGPSDDVLVASERQRDWLLGVAAAVAEAVGAWDDAGLAVAADAVVRGIEELDALTGADTREDVLDAVFARFCIGK